MDTLNTLVKLFQDGAILTNEELNLIVSYINLIVEYINNNIKPAIENGILGKNGRDGVDGKDGKDGIEGISSLNAFVGAVDATDALSKFNNNRNQTTYPPDGFFIGSNVSLLGNELLFMTSARRRGEKDWLYGSDGYIWSVPVLLGSNTTSTTGVDSDTINYVYCRTKRNVDAESFFPSNELLQKRIINYVELSPNNGIKIIGLVETTINNILQASVNDINGAWTDHPYGIDENLPHEWMAGFKKDSNDEWEYYFGPVMISNYGFNGLDGDGFEYIFKGFSTEQTSWPNDDTYPPNWIGNHYDDFLEDDYLGPNNSWQDDAIGVNDTVNKFIYVCTRKKYVDDGKSKATWHAFSPPKLWSQYVPPGPPGPEGRRGAYTLFIFKTTSSDLSNSANYSELNTSNASIPSGWNEAATNPSSSSEYIWSTHRLISYNSSNEEIYKNWQTPYKISGPEGPSGSGSGTTIVTTVYLLVATVSEIRYGRNHAGVVTWNPSTFNIQLFKYEGTAFSPLNSLPSGYSLLRTIYGENISSNTANVESLESINSSKAASYTSNGNTIIGDGVKFEVLDGNHNIVAVLNLPIVREYLRMLIPMGIYTNKKYDRTDTTVPLVLGSDDTYYYLDADTNRVNDSNIAPTDKDQTVWAAATEYEVILTKALFADFAKLGSFVVYGNYFFSQYGELRRYNDTSIIVNETNYSTLYVSGSDEKVPYGYFDPNDPTASNLDSNHPTKFMPAKIINALTGEEWMAGGKVYIDVNGKVTMNDIYVKNGVMSHKVKTLHRGYGNQQNTLEYYMYLWNNENTDNEYYYPLDLSLTCDHLFIVGDGSNNRTITIHLPPAHYFIGQRIIITNNTINYISGSINIMLDYYYYDVNTNKIIVLTDKEFMDGGKYYSEEEEGAPFIPLNNIIQEGHYRASGIWSPRSGGESADNDYIYMSCNVNKEFNINDYEWVEFTAVEGILKNSSAYTTNNKDEELNFVLKFNAIWMLSRWEKKLEELN